jgi:hypothetical protein
MEPMAAQDDHSADWTKVLDWAEKQGLENMEQRHATAELLAKEAATTLTLLLAGLGGALAYGVKLLEPGGADAVEGGAALLCVYLAVLSVLLTFKCLLIGDIPAITNEPKNLAQRGYSFDALRAVELRNLQQRIDHAVQRNVQIAKLLNRFRVAAACSPLMFAVGAGATFVLTKREATPPMTIRCVVDAPAKAESSDAFSCEVKQ